jgi:hypothetical protein
LHILFLILILPILVSFFLLILFRLYFLLLGQSVLGGGVEERPELGDVLLEGHGMGDNRVVLDICDFKFPESDECHQVGLDVLLQQRLRLALVF